MATQYREHITTEGERWDAIAWRYYGDPLAYEVIIQANPQAPITPQLPGGLALAVPVIDPPTLLPTHDLPPWKQGQS